MVGKKYRFLFCVLSFAIVLSNHCSHVHACPPSCDTWIDLIDELEEALANCESLIEELEEDINQAEQLIDDLEELVDGYRDDMHDEWKDTYIAQQITQGTLSDLTNATGGVCLSVLGIGIGVGTAQPQVEIPAWIAFVVCARSACNSTGEIQDDFEYWDEQLQEFLAAVAQYVAAGCQLSIAYLNHQMLISQLIQLYAMRAQIENLLNNARQALDECMG